MPDRIEGSDAVGKAEEVGTPVGQRERPIFEVGIPDEETKQTLWVEGTGFKVHLWQGSQDIRISYHQATCLCKELKEAFRL